MPRERRTRTEKKISKEVRAAKEKAAERLMEKGLSRADAEYLALQIAISEAVRIGEKHEKISRIVDAMLERIARRWKEATGTRQERMLKAIYHKGRLGPTRKPRPKKKKQPPKKRGK